jgi:hypothetical protein
MIIFMLAAITTADLQKEFPITPHNKVIVNDAKARWVENQHSTRALEDRIAIIVDFPDRRCVLLKLRSYSVGGSPLYCYERNKDALVNSYEIVE